MASVSREKLEAKQRQKRQPTRLEDTLAIHILSPLLGPVISVAVAFDREAGSPFISGT